jgi:hypothetical protein
MLWAGFWLIYDERYLLHLGKDKTKRHKCGLH